MDRKDMHGKAVELETIVRQACVCDRGDIMGIASADYLESYPSDAAVAILAFLHKKLDEDKALEARKFLHEYRKLLNDDVEKNIDRYVKELNELVKNIDV